MYSQATQSGQFPILLIADARNEEIRLRWAPTNIETWELASQNGYRLTRIEESGTEIVLAENLRPIPKLAWKALIDTIEFAALYPAALYDEEFREPKLVEGTDPLAEDYET
ncbi:MAG: hypothetical protein AAFY41_15615, partial [Bacteroidota bacterium]